MTTDESNDTYEAHLPVMATGAIATGGTLSTLRMMGAEALTNPLQPTPQVLAQGRQGYGYFCTHCHGPRGDGHGTVGQSFAPLPTNLTSERVQRQSDADLFFKIGFGFNRHPDLSHTMLENDIWAVVHYLRRIEGQ
jgi:mono/diheme cytochrome c family protein